MTIIPLEVVDIILLYLELDVQWSLRDQSQWKKIWKLN
jgi:hypothetical protein